MSTPVGAPPPSAAWLQSLRARTEAPPRRARQPLCWEQHVIGSVEPDLLTFITLGGLSDGRALLQKEEHAAQVQWRVRGDLTLALERLAHALRDAGVGRVAQLWRDEQLAVCGIDGARLGTVERGIVRALGLATQAVHLVGCTAEGRHWVQRRSRNKATDPGLWDTLMGGMVAARDTLHGALERETWEEAGLRLHDLADLQHGGRVRMCKPAGAPDDVRDPGYVVEEVDWFKALVPQSLQPSNQDGEVDEFALLTHGELLDWLERDAFTAEAALVLVQSLQAA